MWKPYLLAVLALACTMASTSFANPESNCALKEVMPVGKVRHIYVRADGGLFVEVHSMNKVRDEELWAEVEFAEKLSSGNDTEFVRLPDSRAVQTGDIVEAKVIEYNELDPSPIAPESHVTKIVAKHDSVAAMAFELKLAAKSHNFQRLALSFLSDN